MDPRTRKQPLFATDEISWLGLAAGPLAWMLEQGVSYAMVPWACDAHHRLPLHLVSLATLLLAAAGAVVAARDWRRHPASSEDDDTDGRARFLALVGLLMCLLFGLVVLMEGIAKFYFDPCQR